MDNLQSLDGEHEISYSDIEQDLFSRMPAYMRADFISSLTELYHLSWTDMLVLEQVRRN